ncbi:hypothetical protein GA0116948_106122 [Chitinophaga costaii]|uniref:DUF4296 domain-containing protein n=1 Tax=Chitinophaga costaii TaxID=1335309 RepID=A0A1C4DUV7_9BACT|nr:hypothetical protein [Chitinophaga costaii]SCC35051.1 hypothetical protein GA0116948_106122 [Chitinophaga costaii]
MKHLLSILLFLSALAGTAAAKGVTPGDNDDDRGIPKTAVYAKAIRLEEFMWILPSAAVQHEVATARLDQAEFEKAVVDLYKWYLLANKNGTNNQFLNAYGKELSFHFKVDPKTLQLYLQFIKNNFPGLSEEDLINDKKTAANRKKFAPVSTRDDMESPMSFSLTK